MSSFIRKILGLGPVEPMNVPKRYKSTVIQNREELKGNINESSIFPLLISERTNEIDFDDDLMTIFHEREGVFGRILITSVVDSGEEKDVFYIKSAKMDQPTFDYISDIALKNLDNRQLQPWKFWNPSDSKLEFQILSADVSVFTSERILSKTHMLEAHKILESKSLVVSIPRRGLIFVCKKGLQPQFFNEFVAVHAATLMDNKVDMDILCEDLFIVENGEVTATLPAHNLSEALFEM